MLGVMGILAAGCVLIGILPWVVLPVVERAVASWIGKGELPSVAALSPVGMGGWVTWMGVALAGGVGVVGIWLALVMKGRSTGGAGTWDCGYARPGKERMQYTGASFAAMLVDLGTWALWPRGGKVRLKWTFAARERFSRGIPDAVLDRVLMPAFGGVRRAVMFVRGMQQASVQAYLVYVLVIIVVLILVG
jgi:hypothetical protein